MNPQSLSRRDLLRGALAGGIAATLGGRPAIASAFDGPTGKPGPGKIGEFRISLAEWSLHNALRKKEIDNLDFPRIARQQFGITGVEFVNQFFKDKAGDSAYLKDLKKRADDQDVTCVLIMIDGEGDLSTPDKAEARKAIDNHKKWVDAALALHCHAIRVNTGNHYSPTDVKAAAENCAELASYGGKHGIHVICENHGGPSSDPDALLALIQAVGSGHFGTLPDFGNFPKKDGKYAIDVYDAIARMMPFARGVSAKSYDFDSTGKESNLDFARIMKIVSDSGYHDWVGIEYEGSKLSEPDGILATKKLLDSLRDSLYAPE